MGALVFRSVHEHLLSVLLSLEYMVLGVFIFFILSLGLLGGYYSLIYLIIAACEGALGLSVLIVISRSYGGDYLRGLRLISI